MLRTKILVLLSIITILSCSKETDEFVTNVDADSIDKILNVNLYDINQEGEAVTISTAYLKEKWEGQLFEEGFDVDLHKFQILESETEDSEKVYFLKAVSKDGTLETGAFIEKSEFLEQNAGLTDGSYVLKGKTCTCQGCATSCVLTVTGKICRCSDCPPGPILCIKTETIVIQNQ